MTKSDLLCEKIKHIDMTAIDPGVIDAMRSMSFTARDLARAADIFCTMLADKNCTIILTLAGSTGAAGCLQVYADMVKYRMVDVVVATGACIFDMDLFEALGFHHYKGNASVDDKVLRSLYIDRIYDTYIDEEELQVCDKTVKSIADAMEPGIYSSREFIAEAGKYLTYHAKKKNSLVQVAYENNVPIFCPAIADSCAGFGLVMHQQQREHAITIDNVKDLRELTEIKIRSGVTGLLMVGGGVPKNFAQDVVICAECLGHIVPMHKYAIQITVADVRDGACSSSSLREANSWGKVDSSCEQMVFAEATSVIPLIASYAYHHGAWKERRGARLEKCLC